MTPCKTTKRTKNRTDGSFHVLFMFSAFWESHFPTHKVFRVAKLFAWIGINSENNDNGPRAASSPAVLSAPRREQARLTRARECKKGKRQMACKPGSVPGEQGMTIHLGRLSPGASRDLPGWRRGNAPGPKARHPYSVLLPVGFTLPPLSPGARCALTAPFHPCRPRGAGGLLSVALSLGSRPPGVTRHRVSVEPGLSSPGPGPGAAIRPSGPQALRPLAANRQ